MRVKLTADLDLIDPNKIDKFIKEEVGNIFKNAVIAFLTAMFQRIPVRTGFLQGSYRDIANAFGVPVLEGGSNLTFRPDFRAGREHATIFASVKKLDRAFSKDKDFYIPKGGGGAEIKGRINDFKDFLKSKKTIEAPYVSLGESGSVSFINGRHRFSVLRDKGFARIPITIDRSELGEFHKRFSGSSPVETYTHSDGSKVIKTPSSGVMFVTPAGEVLTFEANEVVFNINNEILYLNPNDTKYGWLSQQYGLDAFFQQLRSEVGRLGLKAEKLFTKVNIS